MNAPCLIFISVFPTLLQDIISMADKWGNNGKTGRIDPFVEIYDVSVFLGVSARLCAEFFFHSSFSS